ncbi:hypothetical protein NX722_06165 [Endozoicomonas gorgoniicola]|uniref:Uncharacterized protein n=1 Tax=Endozoicomonas gorgoniicola TaxID=1234144 RepID=A0ABT3MT15_9GAMM|nr:hypothetical protein [Endozoicomonas gorgoniicola]MCW7552238.1 hypothetical protein [Endozoicomonas gorgoniicola]
MYPDLEKLLSDLSKISPLKAQGDQLPGDENCIFQLEKSGEYYFLMQCPFFENSDRVAPPLLDGFFMYAILASFPQQVMVGAGHTNENYRKVQRVRGHVSITLGADALYAGELVFSGRRLVSWNHVSGHFLPTPEQRHTQLTPNVKRLLPEYLFVDPIAEMHRRRHELLQEFMDEEW